MPDTHHERTGLSARHERRYLSTADILQEFQEDGIVAAIENNLFEIWALLGKIPSIQLEQRHDFIRFISGLASPLCNSVFRASIQNGNVDQEVEAVLDPFKARNLPMFWWTGPATQPADLAKTLEAHGLSRADSAPGMAMDLSLLQEPKWPSEFTIKRVDSPEMLHDWSGPMRRSFEMPDFVIEFFNEAFTYLGFDEDFPYQNYVGYWKGESVACSSCFLGAGVAGIYNVGTLEQARGQGIGTTLTAYPLLQARKKGFRLGILHASEMGYPIYLTMGFKEYCRVNAYLWQPDDGVAKP